MTDKEKIKAEVQKWINNRTDCTHVAEADIVATKRCAYQDVLNFINSLPEEPVSELWHDTNKRPNKTGIKTAWITIDGVFYAGWYNKNAFGHEDMRDSVCKFEFSEIKKWCYLSDIMPKED